MSGPKRGNWRFTYDPTPTRLVDLSCFVAKQDAWLQRHGSLIKCCLGNAAFAKAQAARDLIDKHIKMGNPDAGFDAYGNAWNLFNQLYRDAIDAKRKQQQQQRQERYEQLKQQQQHQEQLKQQERQRYCERLKQQQIATRLHAECKAAWQNHENQALLLQWIHPADCQQLASELQATGKEPAEQMKRKCLAWQESFEYILRLATKRASRNSKAVQARLPHLQATVKSAAQLNITVLTGEEQRRFTSERLSLQQAAEEALSTENLKELDSAICHLKELTENYRAKIKIAEFGKATKVVQNALSNCGLSVTLHYKPDGTAILQASGFPTKSVNVEMNPDNNEMKLNMGDKRACIKDVKSLQAELANRGMNLTMTDWGTGKPQNIYEHLQQNLTMGGA